MILNLKPLHKMLKKLKPRISNILKLIQRLFCSSRRIIIVLVYLLISFKSTEVYSKTNSIELSKCVVISHCVRTNWEVDDVEKSFEEVYELIKSTPRTNVLEKDNLYIHAEAATKWMHYIDDLEIKALPERGLIQVRSESRVGVGDNGVNQKRVDDLKARLSFKQN